MNEPKIIEVSTVLPTDPEIFLNWFQDKFVKGMSFGFDDFSFLMSTGGMIPIRNGNTLTIEINHDLRSRMQGAYYVVPVDPVYSKLRIRAIQSPHGGTEIQAVCQTNHPEFETLFWAIWEKIDKDDRDTPQMDAIKPKNLKQEGRYRLTQEDIKQRKKIVKKAEQIFKVAKPKKTWKQIAYELDIPERTLRDWRHNPQYK